jgi:hypothetical protein
MDRQKIGIDNARIFNNGFIVRIAAILLDDIVRQFGFMSIFRIDFSSRIPAPLFDRVPVIIVSRGRCPGLVDFRQSRLGRSTPPNIHLFSQIMPFIVVIAVVVKFLRIVPLANMAEDFIAYRVVVRPLVVIARCGYRSFLLCTLIVLLIYLDVSRRIRM